MSTESIQVSGTNASQADRADEKPETYKVSIGRRFVLWVTFMIFLPFFISMPIIIFMRIAHGNYMDTISFIVIFLFALVGMTFIIFQILAAGRQRVEFYNNKLAVKLPTWRGPTPMGPVIRAEIPYSNISKIEKRGEIYVLMGLLGLREVSSFITSDGSRYVLGYVAENEADAPVPYNKITNELSQKLGKPIEHKGAINGGTQIGAMFRGSYSWDTPPLNSEDVVKIRKRTKRLALLVLSLFFVAVIGGLGLALYPQIIALF